MARRQVGNHPRNEERREARCAITAPKLHTFVLQRFEAADAGAPNHAYAVFIDTFEQPGVGHGLGGGHHRKLREQVHLLDLFAVEVVIGVVALHLTREAGLELGGIEAGDGGGAARAGAQALPVSGDGIAKRRNGAEARDNNALKSHI